MISLKSKDKFEITGRGTVKIINLVDNDLPNERLGFPIKTGDIVNLDNELVVIKGIEAFAKANSLDINVGLLYKNVFVKSQIND
jgi:hypothetical protein